jgi:hypothetical protein
MDRHESELIENIHELIERSEKLIEDHRDVTAKLEEALIKLGKLKAKAS